MGHTDGFRSLLGFNTHSLRGWPCLGIVLVSLALAACGGGTGTTATPNGKPNDAVATPTSRAVPSSGGVGVPSPDGPYGDQPADGLLVKFKSAAAPRAATDVLSAAGAEALQHFSIVAGLTSAVLVPGQTMEQALASLRTNPAVEYAEPNYIVTTFATPNDPSLSQQYYLNQSNDADIDAVEAWDLQTGNDVVIAVIDTGADYNHPDLRNNIWVNPGEIPGNGRDDDGNGFVDDVRGWDFANNDNDPMDDNRHGSHVSGIIAAEGNNSTGIAGVNWKARIMPLKFMGANGNGSTSAAISAIQYAVANGARVSNNSWGGPSSSRALSDAISAANARGHVFVTAAGNNRSNNDTTPSYPASYSLPNIIAVAATTNTDALASFSNYGARSVHVAAPGQSIYSTVTNGGYAQLSGTSMASPVVTGVVGLLLASNPNLTVGEIRTAIMNSADRVSALSGRVASGRVNAFAALQAIAAPGGTPTVPAPPVTSPVTVAPSSQNVAAGSTLQFTASGGTPPYAWSVDKATVGTINPSTGLFTAALRGTGTAIVTATDSTSARGNASVTVTGISVTPSIGQVAVGQTLTFAASGGTAPLRWSSSNTSVASVNASTGVLTALAPGTTAVSVTDANNASASSGAINVTAVASRVTIAPSSQVLGVGEQVTFAATGGTAPYTWSSSAPSVLAITAAGAATAQAPGAATVSASDANGNVGTSGTITVRAVQIQANTSAVAVGATLQLSAGGGTAPYRWSSSNSSVAAVDSATGVVTGVSSGSATITATDASGAQATLTINVTVTNGSITVTPASVTVPTQWWVRFGASGGTAPFSWSLSNPAAGTISPTSGWFHATGQPGATATVTVTDANGETSQPSVVTVGAAVPLSRRSGD